MQFNYCSSFVFFFQQDLTLKMNSNWILCKVATGIAHRRIQFSFLIDGTIRLARNTIGQC